MKKIVELNEYKERKEFEEIKHAILWQIENLEFENEDLEEKIIIKENESKRESKFESLLELRSLRNILDKNTSTIKKMKEIVDSRM